MTGPRLALGTLILGFLLIGFLTAESERDFEFAGEKTTSYSDDEDFMGDQEGSGEEVEGSGTLDRPSGIPALYRVKLNITSLQFTAEIEAARQSRTLGSLAITAQIQRALENLLSSVRGTIRIRIVDFEPGSVMVVFDVDTDGYQTEEEIASALKAALNSGRLEAFRVSPDGFQFNLIRNTEESCSPMVGRPLSSTTTYERNNWANLMINNAFPCNGFVTAWSYYNIAAGSAKIAVIRQTSDTDFEVVSVTDLPYRNSGAQKYELSTPILVRTGDFIGVLYSRQDQGGVIANIRQSDNLVPDSELFQTYYMSAFSEELYEGRRFQMSEFASTERPATFSVQAEMSYENVPDIVVPAPRECGAAEWMCRNRDCIKASYRCDGQVDCYDGTDEQNCVTEQPCRDDEFRCQATKQCISRVFVCDNNDDCGDNSDEVNCGPGRVLVSSYRDGSLSSQYQLQWLRPHSQSSPITYYIIKWRKVTVRTGEITPEGNYVMDQPLTPFYTERVTSDSTSFLLNDLEAATFYQVELSAANNIGQSEPQAFIFRTANPGCAPGQFQCKDGGCIDNQYRCDNSPGDCADDSDEDGCDFGTICSEGLLACPQPDGSVVCTDSLIGCECASGEFQCTDDRRCIPESRRCDSRRDCNDNSDELNCPCPRNTFTCKNTEKQECVNNNLLCDGYNDCSDGSDEEDCGCANGFWQCADTSCVPERFRCDGVPQCEDGSDEVACPRPGCRDDQYTCADGNCVEARMRCDGIPQCEDSSDENGCPRCQSDQFNCADGTCVPERFRCDGVPQCEDASDEVGCPTRSCPDSDFQCSTLGRLECIDQRLQCDGIPDCSDGSDERDCPGCRPKEFKCSSGGSCIPEGARCNGFFDCEDRSDEAGCVCTDRQFRCGDGLCIDLSRRCDRQTDCNDNSDELACPCRTGEFQCVNGNCVPESARCNGQFECTDRSDEANCPLQCGRDEVECVPDRKCLSKDQICDRVYDCSDQSDELNCPSCTDDEFQCESDRSCISLTGRCNGRKECSDGSDEMNCPTRPPITITVSPRDLRIRAGAEALLTCMATGLPQNARVEWSRGTEGLPMQSAVELGKLMIPVAKPMDSGIYTCRVVGVQGDYSDSARLEVVAIGPGPDPDNGPCGRDEAVCQNGQCIRREYRCDGEKDCEDGSDEPDDCFNNVCEPNEFQCPSGQCVMKIWRCDGEKDCDDGFDEQNCLPKSPSEPCGFDEFECVSGDQCIPLAYQCDQEIDCLDRSDEIGCSAPVITLPPISEIEVELGGTFTIICEAVGVPTPLIVWRLNWGNIPTGDRVTTTSEDGRGVLTVRDARYTDAGAYTCEAINNRGSIFAIPDALVIVRRQRGPCNPPFFNSDARTQDECVRCFCFGQTVQCFSSDLQVSRIAPANPLEFVRREADETLTTIDPSYVNTNTRTGEYDVQDLYRALPQGRYYWKLPREFLGDRLTSYGGELKYTIYYEIAGRRQSNVNEMDVVLVGNGERLFYRASVQPTPGVQTSISVPLIESAWERTESTTRRGDTEIDSEYADRTDLMMALQNVEYILIRGSYDRQQTVSKIGGVYMSTAVDYPTEYGQAYLVEECTCPTGYTGRSCQECASGFTRVQNGQYLGQCVSCNCNGHSNDCDAITGNCLNCQHNTYGPQCQLCRDGYYGDARRGTANDCQACPCPLTDPANQFSRTCYLDSDGDVTCANCPLGYEGRRCQRCAQGYVGDPMTPGSSCTKTTVDKYCDPRGSLSEQPNPLTGRCECKENAVGTRCDSCKENTFYLSRTYELGCVRCFCMGVSSTCQSTSWTRSQLSLAMSRDSDKVNIVDTLGQSLEDQRGLSVDASNREVRYRGVGSDTVYFALPSRFLGDRVTAYGGSLRFTISYTSQQGATVSPAEPLVQLSGNDITLVSRVSQTFEPNRPQSVNIMMYEQNWFRVDGSPATREHLLMALADLDSLYIRATYERPQASVSLRDVSLDIAEDRATNLDRAYAVEQCVCPVGYRGLSCEDCATGFTRSGGGLYLGLCVPCQCNGHANECDPETGVCRNCQHNTAGDSCEQCAVGYYGQIRGRPDDCSKCPCPMTEAPNQFSPTCQYDPRGASRPGSGDVICTNCPAGHTGRRCESCIEGYTGNPLVVGDYCKVGPTNVCDCDSRGTVPNVQCDPNTKECKCKPYVQGVRCARCREGYFYLEANNPQGCLKCFCSGITNQCTSSRYNREALRPQLGSDGTHNFALMNRRMNNLVSDGFTVDNARNQITFGRFEGVQRERESLFFQLPAKFRGDQVTSYGGYLRFTLEFDSRPTGRQYRDVDVEIISADQNRMYHLLEEPLREGQTQTYEILLRESSFNDLTNAAPTRETFMTILSNIEGFLIRATYNTEMVSITLRDVSMDTAVPTTTNLGGAPMVEDCRCPEGYTGLSCERCADGYLRVSDGRGGLGRCVRCNCNGHADSCDPETGRCLNCNDNTQGDRCDQCIDGYYGDATSGTPNDCRRCPCPLTTAPNQFSPTCYLAEDNQVTCDRCPTGYTGRQCDRCAAGYEGDPTRPGDSCKRQDVGPRPEVVVSPVRVEEPVGSTVVFQCQVRGQGPFNVVWSRLDSRQLPERASVSPTYTLTIRDLQVDDSSRYVCTATNRAGVTRQDVELRVISGGRPLQVRIDQTRIEVQEGRTARFICSVVSGFNERGKPMYILSWSRQGAQMPVKANDQNGVLVIPNVQRSDAGNYVCMGSDLTYMDEEVAVLIVVDSADQAPVARIEPRYQTVNEGEEVRFQCVATGNPRPRIEWVRGGNRDMNPAAVITSDGLLRIPRAQVTDESEYFCRAINEHGTTEVRTLLYVTPVDRPTITVIVRQTKVISAVGQTARLECYVEDSTGRITVFWSRASGLPLGSSQSNGLLTIPNVQPSYAGNYVCTGTDEDTGRVSTAIAELEVRVQETAVAPTVVVEPENITIPMGSTGTLRCRATGTPEPTVKWMKSREELSSNHQVTGTTLRITNAMMADRGIYVCRAENSAGMDQDWSIVEVERRMRPKIDLYPNSTQLIPVGGSALFQCRVMDGDPPPRITWSKVGGGAMSSRVDTMENGVIMFKQAAQEDQGSYLCTAENDMGVITATATLIVEGPPTIIIQPSRTVYAVIGQRVTLECSADGDPTPSVYWMEPRPRRRGDVALEAEFASFGTPGSAVLDINSVERDDQGTYTCVATNSGGRSEDRVQLIIREGGGDSTGVSITGPSTLSVVEGQTVELICTASDIRNPVIRWRRRDGLLPPGHSVRNGVLTLPQFRQEYGGEYICSTVTATDTYEATVFIIVTVAPRLVISPQRITARAGEAVQLRCTPSGSGPFNIEWSRVGAQMNPRAVERDGILEIRQVTAADAGTYRCVVQSSAGRNEGTAIVYVEIPPSVSVRRRDVYTETNRIATLECDVRGSPTPTVRWEKEGDQLPAQHRIQDGVLTIYNVQEEDAGRYICTAQSSAGSSREFAVLHVSSGGVSPGENVDSQFVNVGDRVSMECIVTGSPLPTIQWTREDSPLPASAILGDGILIIPSAHVEDAGTYTCHATNNLGTLKSKVILYVTAEPQLTAPAAATAALGDSVSLVCDAQGYPSPAITWFRKDGEMPPDYQIVDGDLLIQRVRSEDAGTYYCHAENTYGKKDMPVNLHVGALVPRFLQEPNSYIAYQPLNDVYIDFDILLSLKPESTEGTVLYNGQYEDGGGDFVCFGLNEGYPEFRFDVGSGPAIIRGNDKLALNEWHTVKLTRNRKKGSMIVNEGPAYTGESPGSFIGLDLEGDLYLGSVPDYNNIPKVAGFKEGFHGSVSELKLKGISVNLGAEALEIVGVEPTNTCRQNPCANGATCAAANTRYGYMCMCPQGYMGSRCQEIGERCYQGACGAEGRCYNLDGKSGFACICPLGKTGTGCMADVPIINPFFNQSSFISYPAPDNALFNLNLYLEYKPQSLRDGILLYEGNDRDGSGDFMSLVQKDGYLEFRFDTGSGPAIVRSRNPLRVGEWTRVSASRKNREGTLVINNEDPVTGSSLEGVSPGSTVGLNLKLPMYLGGVDPTIKVSPNAGASVGFVGCMAELKVNDATVELLTAAVESLNIVDCGERRLCERQPCKNGAVCEDLPGPDFKCLCPSTHMGKTCDVEINICLTNSPCQNGASCSITDDGYRCDCPLGYAGDNCETSISLDTDFSFISDSFMEFPKALLPHARTQERQTISFNMKTTQSDGLMIWQGEPDSLPLNAGDYIAIGLQEGYVVFSYDMGSGAAKIMSRKRVDDGQVHSVSVERLGRTGTLTVDTDNSAYGDSQGFLQMLNANGNIYVGGVPLVKVMTDKKYKENFVGCIDSITIHGKGPLSAKDALSGFNVEQCAP